MTYRTQLIDQLTDEEAHSIWRRLAHEFYNSDVGFARHYGLNTKTVQVWGSKVRVPTWALVALLDQKDAQAAHHVADTLTGLLKVVQETKRTHQPQDLTEG